MALRRFFRHPSAFAPLAMSFAALATVLLHVIRFGTAREVDEGTSAHIWQLLMGAQLPVIAFFVARWGPGNPKESLTVVALQITAALAALAPVFLLGL